MMQGKFVSSPCNGRDMHSLTIPSIVWHEHDERELYYLTWNLQVAWDETQWKYSGGLSNDQNSIELNQYID